MPNPSETLVGGFFSRLGAQARQDYRDHFTQPAPPPRPPGPPVPEGSLGSKTYGLIKAQNHARANPAFLPQRKTGTSFCNQAVLRTAQATHSNTAPLIGPDGAALSADEQARNLAQPGSGYREVSPGEAVRIANQGVTVFGVQPHAGHGHIATVRPSNTYFANEEIEDPQGSGPVINNGGGHIGVVHQSGAFLPHVPVRYYAPEQ